MKRVCCVGVDSFHQLQMTSPSSPASPGTLFYQQLPELTPSLLSRSLLPLHAPSVHPGLAALLCVIKSLGGTISLSAAGFYCCPSE